MQRSSRNVCSGTLILSYSHEVETYNAVADVRLVTGFSVRITDLPVYVQAEEYSPCNWLNWWYAENYAKIAASEVLYYYSVDDAIEASVLVVAVVVMTDLGKSRENVR
jgi:hypothetical protein